MRSVPPRRRMAAAYWMASVVAPFLHMQRRARGLRFEPLEPAAHVALFRILRWMVSRGMIDRAEVAVRGIGELDALRARRGAVLLVGPHTALTAFAVRLLFDAGYPITAVTRYRLPPPHTRRPEIPQIVHSPTFLFAARQALLDGGVVFAMIDSDQPYPGVTVPVDTAAGVVHVTDALLRLAVRCGAGVAFIASRAAGGEARSTIVAASAGAEGSVDALLGEFGAFLLGFAAGSDNAGG